MSSKNLNNLLHKRDTLIKDLLNLDQMLKGCYCVSTTTCGKPNCKCARGESHHVERLVWRENGRGVNRSVPKEDVAWIKEMTDNHNEYKKLKKKLDELDRKIAKQLDAIYQSSIKKTKRGKSYLKVE